MIVPPRIAQPVRGLRGRDVQLGISKLFCAKSGTPGTSGRCLFSMQGWFRSYSPTPGILTVKGKLIVILSTPPLPSGTS